MDGALQIERSALSWPVKESHGFFPIVTRVSDLLIPVLSMR